MYVYTVYIYIHTYIHIHILGWHFLDVDLDLHTSHAWRQRQAADSREVTALAQQAVVKFQGPGRWWSSLVIAIYSWFSHWKWWFYGGLMGFNGIYPAW